MINSIKIEYSMVSGSKECKELEGILEELVSSIGGSYSVNVLSPTHKIFSVIIYGSGSKFLKPLLEIGLIHV